MSFKPVKTKCWVKFLLLNGFELSRISSSHHQYKKTGVFRPIPVWGAKKQIPAFHIRTGLKTMGVSPETFFAWLEENC